MHCMKTAFLSNKIQYICISLLLWTMHINTISDFIRSTHLIISWFIVIYHDISWYFLIFLDKSWYITMYHDISRCIMIYHDVSWFIMIYHDISRYIMIYRCFGWSQWQMSLSRQFLSNKTPHRTWHIIANLDYIWSTAFLVLMFAVGRDSRFTGTAVNLCKRN